MAPLSAAARVAGVQSSQAAASPSADTLDAAVSAVFFALAPSAAAAFLEASAAAFLEALAAAFLEASAASTV